MRRWFFSILAFAAVQRAACATDGNVIFPYRHLYPGVRALGMGGAFVAVASDDSAVFTNPAGIGDNGKIGRPRPLFRGALLPNVTVGANAYTFDLFSTYSGPGDDRSQRIEKMIADAQTKDLLYGRVQFFPNIIFGRLQLGLLGSSDTSGYVSRYNEPQQSQIPGNTTGTYTTKLSILSRNEIGPVMGLSIPYKDTGVAVGAVGRYASRATLNAQVEANPGAAAQSTSKNVASTVNQTTGLGLDLGALFRSKRGWQPALGVSLRDVGNTRYRASRTTDKNEVELSNLVAGLSVEPTAKRRASSYFTNTWSLEVERCNDPHSSIGQKIRGGTEIMFGGNDYASSHFALRMGYGDGGPSGGILLDFLLFKIDAATYSEYVPGEQGLRIDRRFVGRLTVDLANL